MKSLNKFIDSHINSCTEAFDAELMTDENKDYRRGFRAGVLFSYLNIKANIGNLDDAATEQSTD